MIHPTKITVFTKKNQALVAMVYVGAQTSYNGVIVLCPAMGVKQNFYKDFALFMAEQGWVIYTMDYSGMGASVKESVKSCTADLVDWAEGIQAVATAAKQAYEGLPLFAVTHSVGGQLLALTEAASDWAAIVTVASQSGYWKHWSGKHLFRMWFFWHALLPGLATLLGYFPAKKLGLFEDLPQAVALQWSRWGRHPLYLKRDFPTAYFSKITCPIRAYSFSDDEEFAPKSAVDWLHNQFEYAPVERIHIEPKEVHLKKIGHFNFFRTSMKSVFWESVHAFFKKESNKRLIKL